MLFVGFGGSAGNNATVSLRIDLLIRNGVCQMHSGVDGEFPLRETSRFETFSLFQFPTEAIVESEGCVMLYCGFVQCVRIVHSELLVSLILFGLIKFSMAEIVFP